MAKKNSIAKTDKRYAKVEQKIAKANAKSPQAGAKAEKKFGYDYDSAQKAGLGPDETGHWPSRNPESGQILKGRKHPTIGMTKQAEKDAGYKIKNVKGTLYSNPKPKK